MAEIERAAIWRVILVKPGAEAKVMDGLMEHRVLPGTKEDRERLAYLPMETVWRKVVGRKVRHGRPLIRGYVFAAIPDDRLSMLHDIEGASGLMRVNGHAACVPAAWIEAMTAAEAAGTFDLTRVAERRKASGKLAPGTDVAVVSGKFAGMIGKVQRMSAKRRAAVVMTVVGWTARNIIDLHLADLEVIVRESGPAAAAAKEPLDAPIESPPNSDPTPLCGGDDRPREYTLQGARPIQSDAAA